jgi:hypothetical protein
MDQFFKGADIGDIADNLLVLSLDAVQGALGHLKAPLLDGADYRALRAWVGLWPSFEFFPYSDNIAFGDTLGTLNRSLPPQRGDSLFGWALLSTPLTDPLLEHHANRPANAAYEWRSALANARDLSRLSVLDLSATGAATLLSMLKQFDDRMIPAEAFAKTLAKEWEPYPEDPKQWEYNLKVKSPWDRHVYETFCQLKSFSLHFDIELTVQHQETHRLVRDYATLLSPADHAIIRRDLPRVLEGQGHYAIHPWQLDRLREYDDMPLETLLPFAREPL